MLQPCIVFFVSGHGFGHASRVIEVIGAIRRRAPRVRIAVRTSARRWLFDLTLDAPIEFHEVECDTGVVQLDSLRLDAEATLDRAAGFYARWNEMLAREAAFLRDVEAGLAVSDIPPLGCAAARAAGVPGLALGNFTWDWIYEGYVPHGQARPDFLDTIHDAYRATSLTLRLPMWGGFGAMDPLRITDITLVARHAKRQPADTRAALGLPRDLALVLLSFGGYGLERFTLEGLNLPGYAVVTTGHTRIRSPRTKDRTPVFPIDERALYDAGFRYEDLVAACDVVVSKPGYGIIAECAANGAALLYTSRGNFAEYDVLVAALPGLVRSRFIPQDDLFAGRWLPHLDALIAQPPPVAVPDTNGAEVAAELILQQLR